MSARNSHVHVWEPTVVECGKCGRHPAVQCADPACPLNASPVDVTRFGDPRKIEALLVTKRRQLSRAADATRTAFQEYTKLSRKQDRVGLDLQALELHYRQVTAVNGQR